MPKIKRIKLTKVKKFFERMPGVLAQNPFLTFLGLLLFALFLGGVIFYFYVILIESPSEMDLQTDTAFKLDNDTYQKILNEWQMRDQRFSEIDSKQYPDIFKGTGSTLTQ